MITDPYQISCFFPYFLGERRDVVHLRSTQQASLLFLGGSTGVGWHLGNPEGIPGFLGIVGVQFLFPTHEWMNEYAQV